MKFYLPDEYLPRVRPIFALIKKSLAEALPEASIEHIGSSAIVGAISKGDLDILVRVSAIDFDYALSRLQKLGFTVKADTLRTPELCMLETDAHPIEVALQLIVGGSQFEDFVLFRDRMNIRPPLVEKYNALKRSCEGMPPDEYRVVKSAFIADVLAEL